MGHAMRADTGTQSPDRIVVTLGGRAVATTNPDPMMVNTLQASSTAGMPALDVLGNLVVNDPTGVVVVRQGVEGLTFALRHGRVVGAFGTGPRGSMQAWSQAARTQEIEKAVSMPGRSGVGLARLFIERCVLEHLPMTTEIGAIVSVFRGDVEWTGSMLEVEDAPSLRHLLMEFARETDDRNQVEQRLQPLSRFVVPMAPPLQSADSTRSLGSQAGDEADFGEGEPENDEPHTVLWTVWKICDSVSSIDVVAGRSVFGRAPTLRALEELQRRGCVRLVKPAQETMMVLPDIEVPPPPAAAAEPPESSPHTHRGTLLFRVMSIVVLAAAAALCVAMQFRVPWD